MLPRLCLFLNSKCCIKQPENNTHYVCAWGPCHIHTLWGGNIPILTHTDTDTHARTHTHTHTHAHTHRHARQCSGQKL